MCNLIKLINYPDYADMEGIVNFLFMIYFMAFRSNYFNEFSIFQNVESFSGKYLSKMICKH